jgi:plastocyanin
MSKFRTLTVATTAGLLVLPAAAQAATKTVTMGPPVAAQKQLRPYGSDANAFFPKQVTVRTGDAVRFVPLGFHNVEFPAKGKTPTPLFAPTGTKISGALDAAGQPYWFNGQNTLGFSPPLLTPLFGKSVTFDAAKGFQSGLPFADKPKPVTLRFTKTGSFTYFCDVHPGMSGTVKVVRKGRAVGSTRADANRVKAQVASAVKTASRLAKARAKADKAAAGKTATGALTIADGLAGPGGVEFLDFSPGKVTVATGTTVTFAMPAKTTEVHTASTGPGNPEDASTFLGALSSSIESPAPDQAVFYPSDLPPAAATLTGTSHGNGFWNSGSMDAIAASPPASSAKVTFGAAGTYTFYCLIHPFMKATVTVK